MRGIKHIRDVAVKYLVEYGCMPEKIVCDPMFYDEKHLRRLRNFEAKLSKVLEFSNCGRFAKAIGKQGEVSLNTGMQSVPFSETAVSIWLGEICRESFSLFNEADKVEAWVESESGFRATSVRSWTMFNDLIAEMKDESVIGCSLERAVVFHTIGNMYLVGFAKTESEIVFPARRNAHGVISSAGMTIPISLFSLDRGRVMAGIRSYLSTNEVVSRESFSLDIKKGEYC